MKWLLALAFMTTQTFANVCTPEVEFIFVEDHNVRPFKTSENHSAFTALEKKMIFATLNHPNVGYEENVTMAEALRQFADYSEYRRGPGSNAGEINYYRRNGKVIAQVQYWPGDNQYGGILEVYPNNKFKIVATIQDGDIYCE